MRARNPRLAALVAVGYLLGYLLVFVHFVVEQHATCAEHGDAHHVEDLTEDPGAPLAAGIASLPGTVDHHCHVLNAVRDPVALQSATATAPVDTAPRIDIEPTRLNLPPPVAGAVWRYAPKQSPPAHA